MESLRAVSTDLKACANVLTHPVWDGPPDPEDASLGLEGGFISAQDGACGIDDDGLRFRIGIWVETEIWSVQDHPNCVLVLLRLRAVAHGVEHVQEDMGLHAEHETLIDDQAVAGLE